MTPLPVALRGRIQRGFGNSHLTVAIQENLEGVPFRVAILLFPNHTKKPYSKGNKVIDLWKPMFFKRNEKKWLKKETFVHEYFDVKREKG